MENCAETPNLPKLIKCLVLRSNIIEKKTKHFNFHITLLLGMPLIVIDISLPGDMSGKGADIMIIILDLKILVSCTSYTSLAVSTSNYQKKIFPKIKSNSHPISKLSSTPGNWVGSSNSDDDEHIILQRKCQFIN